MSYLDEEFELPSDAEEYGEFECPHCREIMNNEHDFFVHDCEEDDLLVMSDII